MHNQKISYSYDVWLILLVIKFSVILFLFFIRTRKDSNFIGLREESLRSLLDSTYPEFI